MNTWTWPRAARVFLLAAPFMVAAVAAIPARSDAGGHPSGGASEPPATRAAVLADAAPEATAGDAFRHIALFTNTIDDDEDWFVGGMYRFAVVPRQELGVYVSFVVRVQDRLQLDELRPHYFLQRKESFRGLLALGVDKAQEIVGWLGIYGGVGLGYTWGDFKGTERDPDSKWTPVVDAGVVMRAGGVSDETGESIGRVTWRIGYQYADRVTSNKHAVFLALGFEG